MYVCVFDQLEATAPTAFMCWLWALWNSIYFSCQSVNNTVYIKIFVITLEIPKIHAKGTDIK